MKKPNFYFGKSQREKHSGVLYGILLGTASVFPASVWASANFE